MLISMDYTGISLHLSPPHVIGTIWVLKKRCVIIHDSLGRREKRGQTRAWTPGMRVRSEGNPGLNNEMMRRDLAVSLHCLIAKSTLAALCLISLLPTIWSQIDYIFTSHPIMENWHSRWEVVLLCGILTSTLLSHTFSQALSLTVYAEN